MKKNNFADLTGDEIRQKELELRNELMLLRLKREIGQLEKTHRFLEIRRDIARLISTGSREGGNGRSSAKEKDRKRHG